MALRRSLGRLVLCVAVALVAAAPVAAAPAAAAQRGVLTKSEYQQLQLAQKRIKSLESSDARNFSKGSAVCTHMRPVSRMIADVRSGCLDLIRLGGDYGKLNARATKCGIDPSSQAALLSCMVPAVQSYHADAQSFYRAESLVDRLAKTRGFSRTCAAVIGDSQSNIAAEGRLAQDLGAAATALQQQNPDALQTLFSQIQTDIRSIRPGPSSLSLCPHQ
jgi:hypothetical protein